MTAMKTITMQSKPKRIHVIPLGDTALHSAQQKCWCHPKEVKSGVWLHNAHDCREAKERAGIVTGKHWSHIAEF